MSSVESPCLRCGACCAAFRVSFYSGECDDAWGEVPTALTEPITPSRSAMRGTNQASPRCVALLGDVGDRVACSIYGRRPTPCGGFLAAWEDGTHQPRCDEARARYGLPPLTPEDWGVHPGVPADPDDPAPRPPARPRRRAA